MRYDDYYEDRIRELEQRLDELEKQLTIIYLTGWKRPMTGAEMDAEQEFWSKLERRHEL